MTKRMNKAIRCITLTCASAALLCYSALGYDDHYATAGDFEKTMIHSGDIWQFVQGQAGMDSSYDLGSAVKFDGKRLGNSDAISYQFQASKNFWLGGGWLLGLGLNSENVSIGQVSGAPVPASIHTLQLDSDLQWWRGLWTFSARLSPALYGVENVGGDDLGFSGGILAKYYASDSVTWSFRLDVAPDSDVPVLPSAGMLLLMNDTETLVLEIGMPRTRLTYVPDRPPHWSVYGGLDLNGAVFRTSADIGKESGFFRYNNAMASYHDLRLGVGTKYLLMPRFWAELEAGYSVYRKIDYVRIDDAVRFEPAPYIRFGLHYLF